MVHIKKLFKKRQYKSIHANSENFIESKDQYFFKQAIDLILNQKFDAAYKMICKRNSGMSHPPGLGSDWDNKYHKGIDERLLSLSIHFMNCSSSPMVTAAAIYSTYGGNSYSHIASMLIAVFGIDTPMDELKRSLRHEGCKLSTELNFYSYEETSIEEYQYLATLDARTCPQCGQLDGKIFFVKDRKVGVNCPPMHDGCRCTTVSVIDRSLADRMERFARDSHGKGIKVPRSMNWTKWKSQYVDKD